MRREKGRFHRMCYIMAYYAASQLFFKLFDLLSRCFYTIWFFIFFTSSSYCSTTVFLLVRFGFRVFFFVVEISFPILRQLIHTNSLKFWKNKCIQQKAGNGSRLAVTLFLTMIWFSIIMFNFFFDLVSLPNIYTYIICIFGIIWLWYTDIWKYSNV